MSQDLIESLRSGSTRLGGGTLSLDREKAREKLRKFQLPDPHQYVLQLVRCAALAGARKVSFMIDADEMECIFDASLDFDGLRNIWDHGLAGKADALNALAIAIGASSVLEPRVIEIQTMRKGSEARLTIRGDDETFDVAQIDDPDDSTRVYLRERPRLDHAFEFFSAISGTLAEIVALRKACAWTSMSVHVNRQQVSRLPEWSSEAPLFIADRSTLARVEHTDPATGAAAGIQLERHGPLRIHCVRDGVLIGEFVDDNPPVPAVGYIEHPKFRTDLTSLSVVVDDQFDEIVSSLGLHVYYKALRRWLPTSLSRRRNVSTKILAALDPDARPKLPPEAWALGKEIADDAIWLRGCGGDQEDYVSLDDAAKDGVLNWVDRPFEIEHEDYSPVLLLPNVGPEVVDSKNLVRGYEYLTGRKHAWRNLDFQNELVRLENLERWKRRPVQRRPDAAAATSFDEGGVTVWASLDRRLMAGGDAVTELRRDGRLLSAVSTADGLIDLFIDGNIEVDSTYSGYHDDEKERVYQAVHGLLETLPDFLFETASAWSDDERVPTPRILARRWIRALLHGEVPTRICAQAGVIEVAKARGLAGWSAEQLHPAYRLLNLITSPEDTTSQCLATLDSLADVPLFRSRDGSDVSLRELHEVESIWWFRPQSDWRERLVNAEAKLGELDDFVLIVSEEEEALIRLLYADRLVDGKLAIQRAIGRQAFLARDLHSPPTRQVLHTITKRHADATVEARLLDSSIPTHSVAFVREGRLLDHQSLAQDGPACHFTIRADDLEPNDDWTSMTETRRSQDLVNVALACRHELLDGFRDGVIQSGKLPGTRTGDGIFFDLLKSEMNTPLVSVRQRKSFPGLQARDGALVDAVFSYEELAEVAQREGFLAGYTTPPRKTSELLRPDLPLVNMGSEGIGRRALAAIFGTGIADAAVGDPDEGERARESFMRREVVPFENAGALAEAAVEADGITVRTGLYWDPSAGANGPSYTVRALVDRRDVESIDVDIPYGTFRAVATGEALLPDASYETIVDGRALLVRLAKQAAREAVDAACARFEDESAFDHPHLRDQLLRFLEFANNNSLDAPFDIAAVLRRAKLFSSGGGTVAYDDLDDLAERGRLFHSKSPRRRDALRVPPRDFVLTQRVLSKWLLVPEPEESSPPEPALPEEVPTPEPPRPLPRETAEVLLVHDLRNLVQRAVGGAVTVEWSDERSGELAVIASDTVRLSKSHPHVVRAMQSQDPVDVLFLASRVVTVINLALKEFTDSDERVSQARLLDATIKLNLLG